MLEIMSFDSDRDAAAYDLPDAMLWDLIRTYDEPYNAAFDEARMLLRL